MIGITKGQNWNLSPRLKITQLVPPKGNPAILRRLARSTNPTEPKAQDPASPKTRFHHLLRSTTPVLLHLPRATMTIPTTAARIPVPVHNTARGVTQAVLPLTELPSLAHQVGHALPSPLVRVLGPPQRCQLLLARSLVAVFQTIPRPKSPPNTLILTLTTGALFQTAPLPGKVLRQKLT